jgi:hypothetical protein
MERFRVNINTEVEAENLEDAFAQIGKYYFLLSTPGNEDSEKNKSPFIGGNVLIRTRDFYDNSSNYALFAYQPNSLKIEEYTTTINNSTLFYFDSLSQSELEEKIEDLQQIYISEEEEPYRIIVIEDGRMIINDTIKPNEFCGEDFENEKESGEENV